MLLWLMNAEASISTVVNIICKKLLQLAPGMWIMRDVYRVRHLEARDEEDNCSRVCTSQTLSHISANYRTDRKRAMHSVCDINAGHCFPVCCSSVTLFLYYLGVSLLHMYS